MNKIGHTDGEIAFTKVRLPYGWLGNMSPYPVTFQDIKWPTVEHLFQALRFSATDPVRGLILACKSPMAAKFEAKKHIGKWIVAPRTEADVENMRMCLKLKLEDNPVLRGWLKETGNAMIIEDCSNRPNASGLFWGAARCLPELSSDGGWWDGENILGKLWMQLRTDLTHE